MMAKIPVSRSGVSRRPLQGLMLVRPGQTRPTGIGVADSCGSSDYGTVSYCVVNLMARA